MELTHRVIDTFSRPSYLLEELRLRPYTIWQGTVAPWNESALNPKNRPNSLDTRRSRWRIDGSTRCGTCLYAVSTDSSHSFPPLHIFVFLPDQSDWPAALRTCLDASYGTVLRDSTSIAALPISKHVCLALDQHCSRNPDFLTEYRQLPFASQLVFDRVVSDPASMRLGIASNDRLEFLTKPVDRLASEVLQACSRVPVVEIEKIQLVRYLHDSVSIVQIPPDTSMSFNAPNRNHNYIFKCAVDSLHHLYHELSLLLSLPPHPNIMPQPLALVTKKGAFGGKRGVVGFVLPLFTHGSIRDILPLRQLAGTLTLRVKTSWCQQVAESLAHFVQSTGTYYSDLRADNVLLDSSDDGQERLILCDFEQRGNWHEWCAPEVLFRQYAENLRAALAARHESTWGIVRKYTQADTSSQCYTDRETAIQKKNRAWFALSPEGQDRAMVFNFGLFMYTVFEGLSGVRRNIANKWPRDPDVEFPTFRHTPVRVQKLIRRCTIDGPDWVDAEGYDHATALQPPRAPRLILDSDKLVVEGLPSSEQSEEDVRDAGYEWWKTELERAVRYLDSDAQRAAGDRLSFEELLHEVRQLSNEEVAPSG